MNGLGGRKKRVVGKTAGKIRALAKKKVVKKALAKMKVAAKKRRPARKRIAKKTASA